MQYEVPTPAETAGVISDSSAIDSGEQFAFRASSSQPSLVSIALTPQILNTAENRRAIMFQRAPRLGLKRLARFVQRSLGVSAVAISLVDGDQQVALYASGLPEPWASRQNLPLAQALSQYPVTSRDSFIIEDALQHPWLHTNAAMQDTGMRAYAGLPLIAMDGQILGALCAVDQQPHRWQSEKIELLQRIALQITNILALDLATQALRILMRQRARVDAQDRCLELLGRVFGWTTVSLWEQPPGAEMVGCAGYWQREELSGPVENAYIERFRQLKLTPGTSLIGVVTKSGAPLWVPDIEQETRVMLRTTMLKLRVKSAFVFPVTIGTRMTGVISCLSREAMPHGQELESVIAVLGAQIGAYLLKMRQQASETMH